MTRTTNARVAGFTFLFYIVVGITSLVLSGRAIRGDAIAAELASVAQHATQVRVVAALNLLKELPGRRKIGVLGDMLELGSEERPGHERVGNRAAAVLDLLIAFGPNELVVSGNSTPLTSP